jgi:hypothetical protein
MMWTCCHVHHVHSMHASSGLPDNLKSHAVGHPWSSHMYVELVSIHMHNEQLLGFCSRRSVVCVRCLLTTVGLPGLQRLGPNTHSPAYSVHRRCQSWLVRGSPDWEDGTIFSQLLAIDLHIFMPFRPTWSLGGIQASQTFIRRCWSDQTIEFLPDTARPTRFEASPLHASKLFPRA